MSGTGVSSTTSALRGSTSTVPDATVGEGLGLGGCVAGGTSLRWLEPVGGEPDRDGDREDRGDGDTGHGRAAALDAAGATAYVGDGEGRVLDRVDPAVQGVVDLVLEGSLAHRASPVSWGLRERGARARSAARARLAWDLTVPGEMPSSSAISASLSCS